MTDVPRRSYLAGVLDEADLPDEPLPLFRIWVDQAFEVERPEPTAMTLATVSADGQPSSRVVLMRYFDERGVTWFTNYESRKADELASNPRAALLFYWGTMERVVRIEGRTSRLSDEESDAYFATRPPEHRLGAWASDQSRVVPDRAYLDARLEEARERFGDDPPRPPHWGGYRLVPDYFEFWQGRTARLHDRIGYRSDGDGSWERFRLAP
jgi:pyridoxamine 5'-phosphate oxidase